MQQIKLMENFECDGNIFIVHKVKYHTYTRYHTEKFITKYFLKPILKKETLDKVNEVKKSGI